MSPRAAGLALTVAILVSLLIPFAAPMAGAAVDYTSHASAGAGVLIGWYNWERGLWDHSGWWNSANALDALIDYVELTHDDQYLPVISNTFNIHSPGHFLNDYYDDEGWWALAWIEAYDLTEDSRFLNEAETIFKDLAGGWDGVCNGGIWWSKARNYKNAISNELFLTAAVRLHLRTGDDSGPGSYLDWALREWNWFRESGLINGAHLVEDGLSADCSTGGGTWSYNQGVILGGLADLYRATGDVSVLDAAESIADAATGRLAGGDGVLRDLREPDGNNSADQPQFKGIFMRNLGYLYQATSKPAYRHFILVNGEAIWSRNRSDANQFGASWGGPFDGASPAKQASALDAFNAALRIQAEDARSNLAYYIISRALRHYEAF